MYILKPFPIDWKTIIILSNYLFRTNYDENQTYSSRIRKVYLNEKKGGSSGWLCTGGEGERDVLASPFAVTICVGSDNDNGGTGNKASYEQQVSM